MKIESIQISNILSFKYYEDIDKSQKIELDNKLNIILGPNGSGKSNFLEIINQLFKRILFENFKIDEATIKKYQEDPQEYRLRGAISSENIRHSLKKNFHSKKERKEIKIAIEFSDDDINNLIFIYSNVKEMRQLFRYIGYDLENTLKLDVSKIKIEHIRSVGKINLHLVENRDSDHKFTLDVSNYRPIDKFVSEYMQYFNLINCLIYIGNKYESKNWNLLNNTFALIGESINYNLITSRYKIVPLEETEANRIRLEIMKENARYSNSTEPSIFLYVKHKIAYLYDKFSMEYINNSTIRPQDKMEEQGFFKEINNLLKSTLNLSVNIRRDPSMLEYIISFKDVNGYELDIHELSAGEKSIIHFVFCIYGYELNDGLMMIDEPESHIHPQIQRKFLNILFEATRSLNMQFIIVTHSSIMVDQSTIKNIFRFYKDNENDTEVVRPELDEQDENESTLIRLLTYTNSSKIFFANKIILVEGPTDEYFYRVFLDKMKNSTTNYEGVEIIAMYGKDDFTVWRNFLEKFKIRNYYIGDLDNVLDSKKGLIDPLVKQTLLAKVRQYDSLVSDNQNKKILEIVKSNIPDEWTKIQDLISKHLNNIFILSQGELEDYLQVPKNGLEEIVQFCQSSFDSWYQNNNKVKELTGIFALILN
jgi:putative ATP-dependent endonuclease of OLD family